MLTEQAFERLWLERRRELRHPCSTLVTFGTGVRVDTGTVVDYSNSGLRIRTSESVHIDADRVIEIVSSESARFRSRFGKVVWDSRPARGIREFGVRFTEPRDVALSACSQMR